MNHWRLRGGKTGNPSGRPATKADDFAFDGVCEACSIFKSFVASQMWKCDFPLGKLSRKLEKDSSKASRRRGGG